MAYPYLKLHILFNSNGLAIWSGFPDIAHIRKNKTTYPAGTATWNISDCATWKTSGKQVECANTFHVFISRLFNVLMPPRIHVNEPRVFHLLMTPIIHVNKPRVFQVLMPHLIHMNKLRVVKVE